MLKIVIGSDHRGFHAKKFLKNKLNNFDIIDIGTNSDEAVDYPDIAKALVTNLKKDFDNSLGIILCGSGVGVCIAVNKYPKIYGALIFNTAVAKSARQHNNANVLCLSADNFSNEELLIFINTFLAEKFLEGRHQARIDKLAININ